MSDPLSTPLSQSATLSGPAFIGYLAPSGAFESYTEEQALQADYHHSFLVKDLEAYEAEGTLTFVRNGGGAVVSVKGTAVIDPFCDESVCIIAELARRLIAQGLSPETVFEVEHMGFTKMEAPYQEARIGTLDFWSVRDEGRWQPGEMPAHRPMRQVIF